MCRTACSKKCSHSCLDQLPCDGDNELGHMFMGKLDSKVAIITGGSGGIGGAAAILFASEGCRIVLVDLDSDAMESIVADIGADQAMSVVANVSDAAETQAYVAAAVERFGGVDIALLNAGIEGVISPISEYTEEMFDKVISVNVRGVFLGLKYIMPAMGKRGGGSIVITSSTAGIRATRGMSAYITSKHAVIGLMRTAALEGAESNICVNTVNPAPIDTRMMTSIEEQWGLPAGDRSNRPLAQRLPLQRYGEPDEVARLMLFLGSSDSSFCTGGVYMVDGGVSAGQV